MKYCARALKNSIKIVKSYCKGESGLERSTVELLRGYGLNMVRLPSDMDGYGSSI